MLKISGKRDYLVVRRRKMSTLHYLENAYHQEPCNEEIVHRLIQFYNQTDKTKKGKKSAKTFDDEWL